MTEKLEHVWYKCHGSHPDGRICQFCDGGLGHCTVCKGFEGTLSTDCPGVNLHETVLEAIYKGGLDYYNGEWTVRELR